MGLTRNVDMNYVLGYKTQLGLGFISYRVWYIACACENYRERMVETKRQWQRMMKLLMMILETETCMHA